MNVKPARNGAVLTAQEVTVQTAQVEISVIRVGKRQVTQAMFRQIPYKSLIDFDTLTLRGTPWGHVRYFWEGCHPGLGGRGEDALHVLWQDGDELRRALVYAEPYIARQADLEKRRQWAVNGAFILADRTTTAVRELSTQSRFRSGIETRDYSIAGVSSRVELSSGDYDTVKQYWRSLEQQKVVERQVIYQRVVDERERTARQANDCTVAVLQRLAKEDLLRYQTYPLDAEVDDRFQGALDEEHRKRQKIREDYEALVTREGIADYTFERCIEAQAAALAESKAIATRYAALFAELCTMPQLFIAV